MKLAILGYGNIGKGVESAIQQNDDFDLFGIFTRRNPDEINSPFKSKIYNAHEIIDYKNQIDCVILCGGSATDLPSMTPEIAQNFNVVDSFDTHAKIPQHFKNVDIAAKKNGHIALISAGWDPGLFSINRVYAESVLPNSATYTFWGKGVSQGHSDAIRRIEGVLDARQYTIPVQEAVNLARSGKKAELTTREKHTRLCYVVAKDGADKEKIENKIINMPNYFDEYDTTVNFISKEELEKNHSALPHGGFVICSGKTGKDLNNNQVVEYSLQLDSNPEFTASAILAFARAILKMHKRGEVGCKTVLDIAPSDLSLLSKDELLATRL